MTDIQDKFNLLLQSGTLNLGQPIRPEEVLTEGGSKQFYEFGAIYFHPRIGTAFELHGLILQKYIEIGEHLSGLGYPLSDESDDPNVLLGRMNQFERGSLNFDPAIGVTAFFDENQPIVPQVVVKIVDAILVGLDRGMTLSLNDLAAAVGLLAGNPLVEAVRIILPDLVFSRLYDDLSSAEILDLVAVAQQNEPDYVPPLFDNYLVVDCPDGFDTETLADAFNQWVGLVELAYSQSFPSDPAVIGTSNPLFSNQGYLGGLQISPNIVDIQQGISVQAAWAKGADGSDTRFVDLEQGWFLGHEDLPKPIPFLGGINRSSSFPHGCAVLGEIVAIDNNRGIVGIAPNALPRVISYFDPVEPFGSRRSRPKIASRILASAAALRFGDVLLLEVQLDGTIDGVKTLVPAETDPGIFEAIKLLTKVGIIVVEPAANGNANLDHFTNIKGQRVLNISLRVEFKDSGAIMVGACTSASPNGKQSVSNFGNRIDCWAWGENIITTGDPNRPRQADAYWNNVPGQFPFFAQTSGAAPIITGMCLLIQNLQILLQPRPGSQSGKLGRSMREILRNPLNGSAVTGSTRPMPDMAKIIANQYL